FLPRVLLPDPPPPQSDPRSLHDALPIYAKPMCKTLGEGGLASTKVAGEKDDVAGAKWAGYSHSKLLCGRQVGQVQGLSHGYTHCLWTRGRRDPMGVTSS